MSFGIIENEKVVININELGPVKEQVIELKPVMLFTGESGLGKSHVNFLAYYLFYVFLSERMHDCILENGIRGTGTFIHNIFPHICSNKSRKWVA